MSNDFASIIADYRERCSHLLQEAEPGSAEQSAYSHILQAFDQDKDRPSNERVVGIPASLMGFYRSLPDPEVNTIIRQWSGNFIRDTGQNDPRVHF
jgi:hypothetical protein